MPSCWRNATISCFSHAVLVGVSGKIPVLVTALHQMSRVCINCILQNLLSYLLFWFNTQLYSQCIFIMFNPNITHVYRSFNCLIEKVVWKCPAVHIRLFIVKPETLDPAFPDTSQTAGAPLTFTCTGGSSNPSSTVTWELGTEDITEDAEEDQPNGNCNGHETHSILDLTASRDMNGLVMKCGLVYEGTEVEQETAQLNITCESEIYSLLEYYA